VADENKIVLIDNETQTIIDERINDASTEITTDGNVMGASTKKPIDVNVNSVSTQKKRNFTKIRCIKW
jgi:hypothetical protein